MFLSPKKSSGTRISSRWRHTTMSTSRTLPQHTLCSLHLHPRLPEAIPAMSMTRRPGSGNFILLSSRGKSTLLSLLSSSLSLLLSLASLLSGGTAAAAGTEATAMSMTRRPESGNYILLSSTAANPHCCCRCHHHRCCCRLWHRCCPAALQQQRAQKQLPCALGGAPGK